MKEMEIIPLNSTCIDECAFEPGVLNEKKPLQVVNGPQRLINVPEKSPYSATYRDVILPPKLPHLQSSGENYFSGLSEEVILHIFKYLPKASLIRCARVCKRWTSICYDESLWTRFDCGKKYVQSGVLEILIRRGVCVLRLAMAEIKSPVFLDPEFTSRQRFSKLQYLDLSVATVSAESLANIFAVCNMLKKLSLESCALDEDCCNFIAQNGTLEVLNMCMCTGLGGNGLKAIASNCVKLKEWNLAWTHLKTSCMATFLPFLPNSLARLNISGHPMNFTDDALVTVVNRCPNLIELDVSDCNALTGVSFMILIEHCTQLEHLHTTRCYNIPTKCNRYLKNMTNFKHLEIFRTLTNEALTDLRDYMPKIKINAQLYSAIARPTVGNKRTSIWELRTRD